MKKLTLTTLLAIIASFCFSLTAHSGFKLVNSKVKFDYDDAQDVYDLSNPGAEAMVVEFSNGMDIKMAMYDHGRRMPVVIFGGHSAATGFYHYHAKEWNQRGHPVAVVNMPGLGRGTTRSGFYNDSGREIHPRNDNGYSFTVEGMATLYMGGLSKALQKFFGGRKILPVAQSRGGYMLRAFGSGYRVVGRKGKIYVIEKSETNFEKMQSTFAGLGMLASPAWANDHLVKSALSVRDGIAMALALEREQPFAEARAQQQMHDGMVDGMLESMSDSAQIMESYIQTSWMDRLLDPYFGGLLSPTAIMRSFEAMDIYSRQMERGMDGMAELQEAQQQMEALAYTQTPEFILSDEPFPQEALQALRRDPRISQLVGTDDEIRERIEMMRLNLGPNKKARLRLNRRHVEHMMKYGSTDGEIHPASHNEFVRMQAEGGWKSLAVDKSGQPIKLQSSYVRSVKKGKTPPIYIVNSDTDLSREEAQREAGLNPNSSSRNFLLHLKKAGHGGLIADHEHSGRTIDFLSAADQGQKAKRRKKKLDACLPVLKWPDER